MKKLPVLKLLDILVIALAAALTAGIGAFVYSGNRSSSHVIIKGPDKTWIYPLNSELEMDVSGSLGETRVVIHNRKAAIISSPCTGQTCIAAGALQKNGQWAACLPNRVFVLVEGDDRGESVDAASF